MERIRLLLIDDHVLFRESLGRLFASEPDMEVVGQCGRIADALEILRNTRPDVVLLDFNLGPESGNDFIVTAREAGFAGKILMVTAAMDAQESLAALQLGASGVFLKHNSPSSLTKAIHMVASGEVWLDRRIVQVMTEHASPAYSGEFNAPLTGREEQVLQNLLEGATNRRIAAELGLSEGAVKAVIQQLFRKTGVRTRSQLVRVALEGRLRGKEK